MGTSISSIITVVTPPLGTAPSVPTSLSVSNISTASLTLSWSASTIGSAPITYQPLYMLASGTTWSNVLGTVTLTGSVYSVPVTGLQPATAYSLTVSASNSSGTAQATAIPATTLAVAPGQPTGLAVVGSPTQTSVNLQWVAPAIGTGPFSYQLYDATPSGSGSYAAIGSLITTGTTGTASNLTQGTTYDFEVTASNSAGAGPASAPLVDVITAGTNPANVPGPAGAPAVSNITSTTLTLTWTAPTTGATPFTYQPQYGLSGATSWTNFGGGISALTVSVTGLTPNTAYQFQIQASNTFGSSTSSSVGATTLALLPGAATGLAVSGTPTQSSISLTWSAPSVGTTPFTYQVYDRTPSGSGTFAAFTATTTATSQTIGGLTAGAVYDFEVSASNTAGTGAMSSVLTGIATASGNTSAPTAATGLTVSALTATTLTLSWTAPGAGTTPFTYQPQQAPSGSSTWTNIGSGISATTVAVTGLTANTAYQFQIVTSNNFGSSTSAAVPATTLSAIPGPPTSLAVSGSPAQTSVALTWSAPGTGTAPFTYQVSDRTPSGSGSFVAFSTTTTSLAQTITGLTAGTTYDFEVTAANTAGTGPPSAVLTGVSTAAATLAPSPATGLAVSALTSTTLTLTWVAPSTGTTPFTYQPQQAPSGSSTWSNIGGGISGLTVNVTGLVQNTAYQFQVVTTNSVGNSTSAAVPATTLSVLPNAPTALAVSGSPAQTSVALTWVAPSTGTTPFTYQVLDRTPTGSGSFVAFSTTTTALNQTITGLTAGSAYDFEVTARNGAGTGPASSVLTNVSTAGIPVAPGVATGLTVSALTAATLTLSWTAPATGTLPFTYQPQQAPSGSSSWANIGGSISATTVNVTGLTAATAYQFQVITTNSVSSSTSAAVAATTPSVIPGTPGTPTVSGSPGQNTVTLVWTAPGAGTTPFTYQVYDRTPTGSGSFVAAGATTTGLTQTVSGLTASTSYDFEVTAANSAGSAASAILTNVVTAAQQQAVAPSAPTNLTAPTVTATSIVLTWTAPATGTAPLTYTVLYHN